MRTSDFAERRDELRPPGTAEHTHSKRGPAITPVKFGNRHHNHALNRPAAIVLLYRTGPRR